MAAIVSTEAIAGKGNGLPNVSMKDAFNMTIKATDTCPKADYDGTNRHTIVVQSTNVSDANVQHNLGHADSSLYNNIWLTASDSDQFAIPDGNACDAGIDDGGTDRGAELELPALVAFNYDVYLKFIGKPGTKLDPVLCAFDLDTNTTWCYTGSTITTRDTGQGATKFKNYTKQLFSVPDVLNVCAGTVCDLFDTAIEGFFWDWSASTGAKAVLRFVPCATPKSGDDPSLVDCAGNPV
jgi:hypothetical protein